MTYEEARGHVLDATRAATAEATLKTFLDDVRSRHPIKIDKKAFDAVTPAMLAAGGSPTS
jgi:hypothetical protein